VTTIMDTVRAAEQAKYDVAYKLPNYRMGDRRMVDAIKDLRDLPCRGTYLDVGCGRGEMLIHARELGFTSYKGTEVVADLIDGSTVVEAQGHDLPFPDDAFDVVSLFDVIEHLPPGDDELVCRELHRVARRHVVLTANNRPSRLPSGEDLHINIRAYDEWDRMFRRWFDGALITWLSEQRQYVSEGWRVDV